MTIGPAPMIRIEEMSGRLGIASVSIRGPAFGRPGLTDLVSGSRDNKSTKKERPSGAPAPGLKAPREGVLDQIRRGGKGGRLTMHRRPLARAQPVFRARSRPLSAAD